MDKTLQIVELMLTEMKKQPFRYQMEFTTKGMCVIDFKELLEKKREIPEYFTHFYEPVKDYEIECNKQFEEFIGGLKA